MAFSASIQVYIQVYIVGCIWGVYSYAHRFFQIAYRCIFLFVSPYPAYSPPLGGDRWRGLLRGREEEH